VRYNVEVPKPYAMEQAAILLTQFQYASRCLSPGRVVQALWPRAVGKTVAAHSRVDALWDGRLTVSVDDEVWREQLTTMASQIIAQVNRVTGGRAVREVCFRVAVPRRAPGRATQSAPAVSRTPLFADPDGISDPVLGRIYRASKKRATS
jgi:predicted nucleic acid-binding Zn ribbon protein